MTDLSHNEENIIELWKEGRSTAIGTWVAVEINVFVIQPFQVRSCC